MQESGVDICETSVRAARTGAQLVRHAIWGMAVRLRGVLCGMWCLCLFLIL